MTEMSRLIITKLLTFCSLSLAKHCLQCDLLSHAVRIEWCWLSWHEKRFKSIAKNLVCCQSIKYVAFKSRLPTGDLYLVKKKKVTLYYQFVCVHFCTWFVYVFICLMWKCVIKFQCVQTLARITPVNLGVWKSVSEQWPWLIYNDHCLWIFNWKFLMHGTITKYTYLNTFDIVVAIELENFWHFFLIIFN